jgi:uncharacterized protein YbcC (UPF0753/DUF2309 family)
MGGFGMEQPTQVTLLDTEKDLFFKISNPASKTLIKIKELAKATNMPASSKLRQGIRAMLIEELNNENLVERIMKSDEYGNLLMSVNSLIVAETKSVQEDKYLVRQGVPQREALTDQSSTTNPKPANTPAVPKVDIQEAAIARHEPDQLVLKDGVWIKESEL